MNKKHLIGYPATFIVAGMITAAGNSGGSTASPAPSVVTLAGPTVTATVAPKSVVPKSVAAPKPAPKPVAPKPVAATMTDGQWVIGEDAPAGRYKTSGPTPGGMDICYYAFKKGEGADAEILDNEILKGRATVVVKAGQVFDTSSCEPWVKVG